MGGAEAGHGHGQHIAGGAAQLFHGADGYQQSEAAVQTARDADDRRLGVGMLEALGEAVGLHFQDQLTALGPAALVVGDERRGVYPAGELRLGEGKVEIDGQIPLSAGLEAGVARPLRLHPLAVQLRLSPAALEGRRLGEEGAVLGDEVVAGEDHVLGALAVAGRSVQVAAEQAGGLVRHQRPAVLGLADRLIAGRKVRNDGGTGQRVEGGGGQSAPQVFADLHAQNEAGHLAAAEEQGRTERHLLPADCYRLYLSAARGELALFVELAVVGQVGLGDKAQQTPAAEDGGAVVQLATHQQRQAHEDHDIQLPAGVQHGLQGVQRALLQRALQE